MNFKIGDLVRVYSYTHIMAIGYQDYDDFPDTMFYENKNYDGIGFNPSMKEFCGKVGRIEKIEFDRYSINFMDSPMDPGWSWTDWMLEPFLLNNAKKETEKKSLFFLTNDNDKIMGFMRLTDAESQMIHDVFTAIDSDAGLHPISEAETCYLLR